MPFAADMTVSDECDTWARPAMKAKKKRRRAGAAMPPAAEDDSIEGLKQLHAHLKGRIEARIAEFEALWREADERRLFEELAFCLLTPQSRARSCWAAVESLSGKELVLCGRPDQIHPELVGVRFKYRKSEYICRARERLFKDGKPEIRKVLDQFPDPLKAREWLVRNILGMGYKEASHFLRNIGIGGDLAILDRHILKNLVLFGVIESVPRSLTPRRYLEIESEMKRFSGQVEIPMSHLDFVLWYREAGEVFK